MSAPSSDDTKLENEGFLVTDEIRELMLRRSNIICEVHDVRSDCFRSFILLANTLQYACTACSNVSHDTVRCPGSTDADPHFICTVHSWAGEASVHDKDSVCRNCKYRFTWKARRQLREQLGERDVAVLATKKELMNAELCRCPYSDRGCLEQVSFKELWTHMERKCPFKPVQCMYKDCPESKMSIGAWIDSNHQHTCVYRPCLRCAHSYGAMTDVQRLEHDKICPGIPIECPDCHTQVRTMDMETHKKFLCEYQLTTCALCSEASDRLQVSPGWTDTHQPFLRRDRMLHLREYVQRHTLIQQEKEEYEKRRAAATYRENEYSGTKQVDWIPPPPPKRARQGEVGDL